MPGQVNCIVSPLREPRREAIVEVPRSDNEQNHKTGSSPIRRALINKINEKILTFTKVSAIEETLVNQMYGFKSRERLLGSRTRHIRRFMVA